MSLSDIIRTGGWTSPSTFIQHYLQDLSGGSVRRLHEVGPFVAIESIFKPTRTVVFWRCFSSAKQWGSAESSSSFIHGAVGRYFKRAEYSSFGYNCVTWSVTQFRWLLVSFDCSFVTKEGGIEPLSSVTSQWRHNDVCTVSVLYDGFRLADPLMELCVAFTQVHLLV